MASKAMIMGCTDPTDPEIAADVTEGSVYSTREQEIRVRAYDIYLELGGQPGNELEDWLQAERELTSK